MAIAPTVLADKSALARLRFPEVEAVLSPLILSGEVATCGIIELEILFSARSHLEFDAIRLERAWSFPLVPILQVDFERAVEVMGELARRGLHRAVGISDLVISAVAEPERLTVLHYDTDFDLVTGITRQSMRWVVPRGTVP